MAEQQHVMNQRRSFNKFHSHMKFSCDFTQYSKAADEKCPDSRIYIQRALIVWLHDAQSQWKR